MSGCARYLLGGVRAHVHTQYARWGFFGVLSPKQATEQIKNTYSASFEKGPSTLLYKTNLILSSITSRRPLTLGVKMFNGVKCVNPSKGKSYTCPLCQNLAKDAVQGDCGCRFCSLCFSCNSICSCGKNTGPQSHKDVCARREMLDIQVFCKEATQGCAWQGDFGTFEEHYSACPFAIVQCKFTECGMSMQRKALVDHQQTMCQGRKIHCEHCDVEITANKMEDHLRNDCLRMEIPCPNSCSEEKLPRGHMKEHLKGCPNEKVKCYYCVFGCGFHRERKLLQEHHSTQVGLHMQLLSQMTESYQRTIKKLEETTEELQKENAKLQHSIKELERKQITAMVCFPREADQTCISSSLPQEATQQMKKMEKELALLNVRVADTELRQDLLEVKMTRGVLVWKIGEISRRQREAESGRTPSLYSPPFFTSNTGYKMCARIYLNGDGTGKDSHVSIFFCLMRGEYDTLLQWPFRQVVTLSILDLSGNKRHIVEKFRPSSDSSSFQRPVSEMNVASGCPQFMDKKYLQTTRFVEDDTMYIRVQVQEFHGPDHP